MKFRLAIALCLTALPALTGAARADTRESVMLRLPRCISIADARGYLDCYYAAVQPMRAELGLSAAPQAATYNALFSGGAVPGAGALTPQAAATRQTVMLRLTRCAAIGDTRQYMDCYYAAVQPLRTELGLAAAPQAITYEPLFSLIQVAPAAGAVVASGPGAPVPDVRLNLVPRGAYEGAAYVPATRPRTAGDGPTDLPMLGSIVGISTRRVPEAQFGLPNARAVPNGVDHVVSPISSFDQDRYTGRFTVTLENGQVWQQVANDDMQARWSKTKKYTATVAYGAGDTFNLTVGDRTLYKVRRVK